MLRGFARSKGIRMAIAGLLSLGGISLTGIFSSAKADERLFTYSYEAEVLPKGAWEFEQWLTGRFGKESGDFARWDFREELEYGLTDRLTTAVYLNFKSEYASHVGDSDETESEFEFEGVSSEWKYQLLSPHKHPIGVLLYGEVTYSGSELELEEKLILQHNLTDRIVLVFNAIGEHEFEFEEGETEKEFKLVFTGGASYKLNKNWAVGVEARSHTVYPDYDTPEFSAFFVGPNIHYGNERWWVTLTGLIQAGGHPNTEDGLELEEHERVEVRCIAGINF